MIAVMSKRLCPFSAVCNHGLDTITELDEENVKDGWSAPPPGGSLWAPASRHLNYTQLPLPVTSPTDSDFIHENSVHNALDCLQRRPQ